MLGLKENRPLNKSCNIKPENGTFGSVTTEFSLLPLPLLDDDDDDDGDCCIDCCG